MAWAEGHIRYLLRARSSVMLARMAGTTDKTKDYLGRLLTNATPGTSDPVTDYLGRETEGDLDFLGRALT